MEISNNKKNIYTSSSVNLERIDTDFLLKELMVEPGKLKKERLNKNNIQNYILQNVEEIDFREKAELQDENKTLSKKHYLVIVIQSFNELIDHLGLGLIQKDEKIYLYNGEYWEGINDKDCERFLGKISLKMGVDQFEAKFFKFKEDLFKQFVSQSHFEKLIEKEVTLINFSNGTFEISPYSQKLREFRKEDFLTYQLPFSYDQTATYPLFKTFINQVLPEQELQNIISEFFGSVFISNKVMKFEKALFLYGSGSNGKSVLFDIIKALIGNHNFSSYSLEGLTKKEYTRAMISDKLLNYSSEMSSQLDVENFKTLVSGEPIGARLPYKNPFMMEDYAKLMFNTNELPREIEHNHGYFRRFLIIPFRVTISEEDQDRNLSQKIIDHELPGIFNWILEGLNRLLINGNFTPSDIVENQISSFRREGNSVLSFIDEKAYIVSSEQRIRLSELYAEYKQYCIANNNTPCSSKTFSKRFEDDGFVKTRQKVGMVFNASKKD